MPTRERAASRATGPSTSRLADALQRAAAAGVTPDAVRAYLAKAKRVVGLDELSDHFDVAIGKVREVIGQLEDRHVNLLHTPFGVGTADAPAPSEPTVIPVRSLKGKPFVFGLTGDNHLCSKYARLDVLNALFDMWAEEGVTTVLQAGNMIDGEARFNKTDLLVRPGMEAQIEYFIEHWPQRKGIVTEFVTGDDHEGWYIQREGINFGQRLEDSARKAGRTDLRFVGHMEHTYILKAEHGTATMQLLHAGGGSSYAISYTDQKLVESYQGGEKPNIAIVGHYHKFNVGYPREVRTIQVGCTQDQTPWMRKKKIQSQVGGVTLKFQQSKDGLINDFWAKWQPFYDRDFYRGTQWQYHWVPPTSRA